jgi:hypothetical protein
MEAGDQKQKKIRDKKLSNILIVVVVFT